MKIEELKNESFTKELQIQIPFGEINDKVEEQVLEAAKSFGDVLILGLNSDRSVNSLKGIGRPIDVKPTTRWNVVFPVNDCVWKICLKFEFKRSSLRFPTGIDLIDFWNAESMISLSSVPQHKKYSRKLLISESILYSL